MQRIVKAVLGNPEPEPEQSADALFAKAASIFGMAAGSSPQIPDSFKQELEAYTPK